MHTICIGLSTHSREYSYIDDPIVARNNTRHFYIVLILAYRGQLSNRSLNKNENMQFLILKQLLKIITILEKFEISMFRDRMKLNCLEHRISYSIRVPGHILHDTN